MVSPYTQFGRSQTSTLEGSTMRKLLFAAIAAIGWSLAGLAPARPNTCNTPHRTPITQTPTIFIRARRTLIRTHTPAIRPTTGRRSTAPGIRRIIRTYTTNTTTGTTIRGIRPTDPGDGSDRPDQSSHCQSFDPLASATGPRVACQPSLTLPDRAISFNCARQILGRRRRQQANQTRAAV